MKIGYLVPEFPGQTHAFFWREIKALQETGIDVDIVSTRPAPREIVCHTWSSEAMRRTKYLFPPGPKDLLAAFQLLMMAGLRRWQKCLSTILSAEGENFCGKLRVLGLVVVGAQLASLARKRCWAHLHVHSCADSAYIAMFAYILADLPYSVVLHGPLRYFRGGQREKWHHAAFALVVSHRLQADIAELLTEIPKDRTSVAAMGVDCDVFARQSPYQGVRASETARIVTCGRLHVGKGHQDLIRAISIMRDQGRSAHLTVLGEGPARSHLESLIADWELRSEVELRGAVAEEIVRDTLEASHLFVLASHEEAIGVATMEAMAMSLPIVGTRVGGVAELVCDGVDGLLVPPKNPPAMAEAIQRLLGDPDLSARMGEAGAKRVRQSFGSHVSAGVIAERLGVHVKGSEHSDPAQVSVVL